MKKEDDSLDRYTKDKKISKEKLKLISEKVLDFYKNYFAEQYDIDTSNMGMIYSKKKSLYVSPEEKIEIPEDYDDSPIKKVTNTMIPHEMEQHLFTWFNTNRHIGK
jgi:hypothetical protein